MTYKKYSKSSGFYAASKAPFFDENKALLTKAHSQNAFYVQQPLRQNCKVCRSKLSETDDFVSHKVSYVFCDKCGHFNGRHDDTDAFFERMYINSSSETYSETYQDNNYKLRTEQIYLPKIDFLTEYMPTDSYSLLDIGCGTGYLVAAASMRNIKVTGIDVNEANVDYGNLQIQQLFDTSDALKAVDEDEFVTHIKNANVDVVSAIGVIEHLREPERFFQAYLESNANYLFYSLPMFSVSALIESSFPSVFPRNLSGDHTHLFTEKSIRYLNGMLKSEAIAEWRFGTDMMDFYRSLMVTMKANSASNRMLETVQSELAPLVDPLQSELDKNHFCSEIHCLIRKF